MNTDKTTSQVKGENQQPLDLNQRKNTTPPQLDLRVSTVAKFFRTLDAHVLQKPTFTATYNDTWKEPGLLARIKSGIGDFFKAIIAPFIYLGAYPIVGEAREANKRTDEALVNLQKIGGQLHILETPDGDKIETLHISAKDFYKEINERYDIVKSEDKKSSYLKLKESRKQDGKVTKDDIEFAQALHSLNQFSICYDRDKNDEGAQIVYDKINFQEEQPTELVEPPTTKEADGASSPTALILPTTSGHGFQYKIPAMRYLQSGVDVMLVNFRGNARSSGTPNDRRLKLDAETCFQFLRQSKKVTNEHILVHGHCAGGGVATDLAARHEGVNLYLDRTFSHIEDFANRQFGRFGKIAQAALDFNNEENLKKATGHIAVNLGVHDSTIGVKHVQGKEAEPIEIINSMQNDPRIEELDEQNKKLAKAIKTTTRDKVCRKVCRVAYSNLHHMNFYLNVKYDDGKVVKTQDTLGNTSLTSFLHDIQFTRKITPQ